MPGVVESARAPDDRRWTFGAAVLDERTLELQVNGAIVAVERKPLEVLLFLLHHAGEVVTKDEILDAVWPGRILSDTVLTKCVQKLREALQDENQELIKTQHGYGYRLIAPTKVEASLSPPPPRFDFKPGDHPPGRPNWNLVERLGTGGHGEVWLARNEKTRQARVFKFALDSTALTSLKREITLYRLLHDAMGEKASIVEIHEWNLEQAPYFIEAEYLEQGSLVSWAEKQGGLAKVALGTRLELAAQIAQALAAAHSVGVLHKDLKPSNILVDIPASQESGERAGASGGIAPRIKLADFGSGGVLDTSRLEALGITRLGFTKTIAAADTTSGTPIYFAPEVIGGQPFTAQADIYSLGVILYQMIVGDFRKPLVHGWERDINDELLQQDIAGAADGDPGQRLRDASLLARRLRDLDVRRRQRATELRARLEAERQRAALERFRARRGWIAAMVLVLVFGLVGSLWLYHGAVRARDSALAVSTFLTQDVLAMAGPFREKPGEMTAKAVVDRASKLLESRLSDEPDAAAQVHFSLGYSYGWLGEPALMDKHIKQAADLLESLHGADDVATLLARSWEEANRTTISQPEKLLAMTQRIRQELENELGPVHPQVIELRCNLAMLRLHMETITTDQAIDEIRAAIGDGQRALKAGDPSLRTLPKASWVLFLDPVANDAEFLIQAKQGNLVRLLHKAGRFNEVVDEIGAMLPASIKKYGEHHFVPARWRIYRGRALAELRRYKEAETDIALGLEGTRKWFGEEHPETQGHLGLQGRVLRASGNLHEARQVHERALALCRIKAPLPSAETAAHSCGQAQHDLVETLQAQGELQAARRLLEDALESRRRLLAPGDGRIRETQQKLIEVLEALGDVESGRQLQRELVAATAPEVTAE